MARKKLNEVSPRTIRVHIPTYDKILEFFSMSPSGIRGSDAIRQVLYQFGLYCKEQMETGRVASARDLKEAEDIIFKTFKGEQ
jgi:hypothetical protein